MPFSNPSSPATGHRPLATLFSTIGYFESSPRLAVAVSGGADSMALLLLADGWAKSRGGRVVALTVDHGLRAGSAAEARRVAAWCATRGIEHHILSCLPLDNSTQDAARRARYDQLFRWCETHGALHLLTGHHRGDQAETLLLRLSRGSNIDGLAAMPFASEHGSVRLLRPLLDVTKSQLENFLRGERQEWIEDPSNQSPRYTRNRLRLLLPPDQEAQAADLANRCGDARNHLENKLASCLTDAVFMYPSGHAHLDEIAFRRLPPVMATRALSSLVQTLSGDAYPPRTEKLERLYGEIMDGGITRRSFGGLIFHRRPKHGRFLVTRETNALAAPLSLSPGAPALWDGRFLVSTQEADVHVRALGSDGLKMLRDALPRPPEKSVLAALPAFWRLEELLAVPHIGYMRETCRRTAFTAVFRPAKALAAAAFFRFNGTSSGESAVHA